MHMIRWICCVSMKDRKTSGELRNLVGFETWLESVEADMAELESDREDVHAKKKWRPNFMNRKSNPFGKRTIIR